MPNTNVILSAHFVAPIDVFISFSLGLQGEFFSIHS